ncbi:hypothetical protein MIMGU_mgv1a020449mg, partial [Erythranthe guttata]
MGRHPALFMEAMEMGGKFNLADYFPFIGVLDLQGMNRRMKVLRKIFDGFLEKIIDDHLHKKHEKKEETKDFVDVMMGIIVSGEAGFEFAADLLITRMDTASTALEWALSELMRHPVVMKKLQKELESTMGMEHMVEESHLNKLNYLDSVVKEPY